MNDALIVSTARTPIARAYRGAFNDTPAQALAGHAIAHALERAAVDPAEVEDCVLGCAMQQGSTGANTARQAALRAGMPVQVPGMTIDRKCSSGLMAIASAARQVKLGEAKVMVAGGVEHITLVQNEKLNRYRSEDPWLNQHQPDIYMTMLETAETVADRYAISREQQDAYALQSQQRTAEAQNAGRLDDEIIPLTTVMKVKDKESGVISDKEITLSKDEGNRPGSSTHVLQRCGNQTGSFYYCGQRKPVIRWCVSLCSDGRKTSRITEPESTGSLRRLRR